MKSDLSPIIYISWVTLFSNPFFIKMENGEAVSMMIPGGFFLILFLCMYIWIHNQKSILAIFFYVGFSRLLSSNGILCSFHCKSWFEYFTIRTSWEVCILMTPLLMCFIYACFIRWNSNLRNFYMHQILKWVYWTLPKQ